MAEWDFESALNDYFGGSSSEDGRPTTEDGDTPLGGAGAATFFAPSGWDFDKALDDYFNGVNGYGTPNRYFAPREYEFPDVSGIGAPEDFGLRHRGFVPLPLTLPTPTITPLARGVTPEDFGLRHRGFILPPPLQTPTPTAMATPTATPMNTARAPLSAEDLARLRRIIESVPSFREIQEDTFFDPTEQLRENYPGIEPWVYAYLAQVPTRARPLSLMPPPYGEEGTHAKWHYSSSAHQ